MGDGPADRPAVAHLWVADLTGGLGKNGAARAEQGVARRVASMRPVISMDTRSTQSKGRSVGSPSRTSQTRSLMSDSISLRFFGATTPCTALRCWSCLGGSMAMNISMSSGTSPTMMSGSAEKSAAFMSIARMSS